MKAIEQTPITAYPPDFIGPVIGYRCNESEWVASTLGKGERCWFRRRRGITSRQIVEDGRGPWTVATFIMAYMYDGVIARVYEDDPDDYIEHSLFLDLGDELRAAAP